jgi:transposase
MSLNVRNYNNKEMLLFPASIGDFLSKDHLAWVIDDVAEQLDLNCLYKKVSSVGNPPYHPKMMLKVLFYGYATTNFSSRKIARGTETDVAFIFLSGMQKPDFRTISDFRKNNLEELSDLFAQIVKLSRKLGLVELGHISLDSTTAKANASKDNTYDEERFILEEHAINKKIKELLEHAQSTDEKENQIFGPNLRGDEIPEELRSQEKRLKKLKEVKKQLEKESLKEINLTDPDATFQRQRSQIITGYRAEIAVDAKEQVIVACDVINQANDTEQTIPLIEQVENNLPEVSTTDSSITVTADSNFSSMKNLKELESKGNIDTYIPDGKYQAQQRGNRTDEDSPFHTKNFTYNPKKDVFLCSDHKELIFAHRTVDDKGNRLSVYRCRSCQNCKYFGKCTKSPKGRKIKIYDDIHLIRQMRQKLDTAEGKRIYSKRKAIVEPPIGNIKHNLAFREFLLRGLKKVKAEFTLMAIVHNIKKIAKFLRKLLLFKLPRENLIPLPAA